MLHILSQGYYIIDWSCLNIMHICLLVLWCPISLPTPKGNPFRSCDFLLIQNSEFSIQYFNIVLKFWIHFSQLQIHFTLGGMYGHWEKGIFFIFNILFRIFNLFQSITNLFHFRCYSNGHWEKCLYIQYLVFWIPKPFQSITNLFHFRWYSNGHWEKCIYIQYFVFSL